MDYKEFVESDKFRAFTEFISVEMAKEQGIIPVEYFNIIKDKCVCGSDMIISRNRKKLMCCDPRCKIKLGFRLAKTFEKFECKNLGPSTCKSVINQVWDKLKYKSHVEALLLTPSEFPRVLDGAKGQDYKIGLYTIQNSSLTLANVIAKLGLPELDTTAREIFSNYKSVDEFIEAVDKSGNLITFLSKLGIHDRKVAYYINDSIPDFYLAEQLVGDNIKDIAFKQVNICLTGRLKYDGLPITKTNYLKFLNESSIASDGTVIFEFNQCSAVDSVPYIVYSSVSDNAKYLAGLERERKYLQQTGKQKKILVTPEELVNIVAKVVKEYEQQLTKQ